MNASLTSRGCPPNTSLLPLFPSLSLYYSVNFLLSSPPCFLFHPDLIAQTLSHPTSPHSGNTPNPSTTFWLWKSCVFFLEYLHLPPSSTRAEVMGRKFGYLMKEFRLDPVGWWFSDSFMWQSFWKMWALRRTPWTTGRFNSIMITGMYLLDSKIVFSYIGLSHSLCASSSWHI